MSVTNYKICDNFYLSNQKLKSAEAAQLQVKLQTNFIFVVDVSGSMYSELDFIRKQLKNKLPTLMNEGDTISIIWFSGKEQAGILKEEVEISSLSSFTDLNNAIDKWLKPMGLTAFDRPLELTKEVVGRIRKNRPNGLYSLIFLSDGMSNNCSWSDVKRAIKNLEEDISSATFVEYGYYADSKAITEMAEMLGGEKVEAENFDMFEPVFADKLSNTVSSKKELVKINGELKYPFCFTITDQNEIIVFSVNEQGEALLNSNLSDIYYFSSKSSQVSVKFDDSNDALMKSLYSAIYVLSDRTLNQEAENILVSLGDVSLYNTFSGAYGKQKLNNFKNVVKESVFNKSNRFVLGRNENYKINEQAYCLLNLLSDLSQDDENLFYPYHNDFKYNRIGAKKVAKAGKLNDSDKLLLSESETIDDVKALLEKFQEEGKGDVAEFINNDKDKGFRLSELVYNEERANISIRAKYTGTVKLPRNKFNVDDIDSFIYRNYTLVKDGIINVSHLPVSLSEETFTKLQNEGMISKDQTYVENHIYVVDLNSVPVINRSMTKKISAKTLAVTEYELLKNKASAKVYSYYEKLHFPHESKSFVDQYGKDCEEWLKSLGVTEHNGFNPSMESVESEDFYMSVNLKTKIKGLSSLPKVEDVENKIKANSPLKAGELLMMPFVKEYLDQINSPLYMSQDDDIQKNILKSWLTKVKKAEVSKKRMLMSEASNIKFSLIMSRGWFEEFASFDENSLIINDDVSVTFELKEEAVKI